MSTSFAVTMPFEEYLAANWLMIRRNWLWRGVIRYLLVLGPILAAIIESGAWVRDGFDAARLVASLLLGLAFAAGALAVTFLWFSWSVPRSARKAYAELKLDGVATTYTFNQTELLVSNTLGTARLPWDHITTWTENTRMILLCRTRMMFFCIPKSQVDVGELEALRSALIAANVPIR
ncbi:YcxB family protein [Novosphingobium sp. CECT 9465]|uniref:YcxB family protein n=1 Tax=Novosphingobium sp. CECT 9465 TaxID=2829794 RepID=UPI001E5514CA|nr:YcxB family protein [Novosphingobium sp. CECT 9465]CAH0496595.1 hypothetical protein NVSP9465_01631 [Novosphingobium sp. CECT 9465]